MSRALVLLVAAGVAAAAPPAGRIPPREVTAPAGKPLAEVAATLAKQADIPIDTSGANAAAVCPTAFDRTPFWAAVEELATKTGHRVALGKKGREVRLVKGQPAKASIDGPFRVAVRGVTARADFETGATVYDVHLDVHWEPRFPVFRLDAEPTITTVADDAGSKLTVAPASAKVPPGGPLHQTTVRVRGVPRKATKLSLAGSFVVTAADRMLPFTLDLSRLPAKATQDGVAVEVTRAEKVDDRFEVAVELTYPESHPAFESFESWVTENRAKLGAADPTDSEVRCDGRKAWAVYRFKAAGKTLTYTTPAPLLEYPVRFELKDIPLP